jgi:hypothetical protein
MEVDILMGKAVGIKVGDPIVAEDTQDAVEVVDIIMEAEADEEAEATIIKAIIIIIKVVEINKAVVTRMDTSTIKMEGTSKDTNRVLLNNNSHTILE